MAAQPKTKSQSFDGDSMYAKILSRERKTPQMADYLSSVRFALGHESQEYEFLLHLFKEWEQKRIAPAVVAALVKLLFSDKQELIERFNQFLPAKYKISLPLPRRRNVSLEGATGFVNKFKAALDKERYLSFLRICNAYRTSTVNILELTRKVCELLEDKQDLLKEFVDYLPAPLKATHQLATNNTTRGETSQTRK
ncbi:hypothetical protein POM88_051049 [Heracleum sosnowskyi]|uniref:Uncharacterized protein n=1 Tax=Heracleum sosnowskyi TaxID=360622 RepID=A0AAD8H172_9APIA|nr:hypothetical protein POM88_051049 [Heracleum sosnowskyi]